MQESTPGDDGGRDWKDELCAKGHRAGRGRQSFPGALEDMVLPTP
jgi:hypothetical protein